MGRPPRRQIAVGRMLVLATAADVGVARAVADHFGPFDEVIAPEGTRNLKAETKAAAPVERFGPVGFAYAGSDRTDVALQVVAARWAVAIRGTDVIVGASRRVAARAFSVVVAAPPLPRRATFVDVRSQRPAVAPYNSPELLWALVRSHRFVGAGCGLRLPGAAGTTPPSSPRQRPLCRRR